MKELTQDILIEGDYFLVKEWSLNKNEFLFLSLEKKKSKEILIISNEAKLIDYCFSFILNLNAFDFQEITEFQHCIELAYNFMKDKGVLSNA